MAPKLPATFRASQRATRAAQRFARNSGFSTATDVISAVGGNAGTTIKGNQAALTRDQARLQGAIERISARTSKQQARTTARTGSAIQNRYGAAVAGAAAPAMANVQAVQKASGQVTKGNAAAGRLEAAGGQQAMGLIQAGVSASNAAASAQLAEAYKYRVQDDAKLLAEQKFAMIQMRTQAQLEFQTWKKQQDYLQKLEDGDATGGVAGIAATAESAASSFSGLQTTFNTMVDTDGDGEPDAYPNGVQAATAYINENGVVDPNEKQLILALASSMYRAGAGPVAEGQLYGPGTSDDTRQALIQEALKNQLVRLYPQFSKHSDKIMAAVTSGISAQQSITNYENLAKTFPTSESSNPAAAAGTELAKKVIADLTKKLGRKPTAEEIARAFSISGITTGGGGTGFDAQSQALLASQGAAEQSGSTYMGYPTYR